MIGGYLFGMLGLIAVAETEALIYVAMIMPVT